MKFHTLSLATLALALTSLTALAAGPKPVAFDYEALSLARAAAACAPEFKQASREGGQSDEALMSAEMTEGGEHEFDQVVTMKFGYAHPMMGVSKVRQVKAIRKFTPTNCPSGMADCGGGSFKTTCELTNIHELN